MINSPTRMAAIRAIKTDRLKRARTIAIKGGTSPKIPYSIENP